MDYQALLKTLEDNGERIKAMVQHFSDQDLRWKPDPDSWSMLEVINHLVEEEEEDFSVRLRITLQGAGDPWQPIDPEGRVTARGITNAILENLWHVSARPGKTLWPG